MGRRLLLLAVALVAVAAALAVAFDGRIAPRVTVAGVDMGGRTASEARGAVARAVGDARVTLVSDGISIELDASAGISPDVDRAIAAAVAVGRTGTILERALDLAGAVTLGRTVPLDRRVDDAERFARVLQLVAAVVERPSVDGDVRLGAADVDVREPRRGVHVDEATLARAVLGAGGADARVALPVSHIEPALGDAAIATAYEAARNVALPLVLVAGSERTVVEPARLLAIARVVRQPGADGDELVVRLEESSLERLADEIADALDGAPRDAVLIPGLERLVVIPGRDGVAVDRDATRRLLRDAIPAPDRVLDVPATITTPALTTDAAQRTSDRLVLSGAYTTYFPVNWARATNIGNAARTFDGMRVAPGEPFSFWDRLGEVSPRTGYVSAGTIIGGVSSEAIGGGLCQVSTTFFNAVARAGYQIDERHPHSYYIERYPLGLDAAVFGSTADLRWTNDTAVPALIRAGATDTSVSFWIYSPPTGRTTEFSEPRQWNVVWPSADQPADPGHVPGYVVPGRDTVVTRTVRDGARVVHSDEWYSHYAPVWGGPAR